MHALYGDKMHEESIVFSYFKETSRSTHFKERNAHTDSLFLKSRMVKLPNKMKIETCLLISKYVNKLPPIFDSWFATKGHLKIPTDTTVTYGKVAFISMATKTWKIFKVKLKIL